MSKNDPLPDNHDISRLCIDSTLDEFGNPTGESFELRLLRGDKLEEYLSVNCLNFLHATDRDEQLSKAVNILKSKVVRGVNENDLISVLNVRQVKSDVDDKTYGVHKIRVLDKSNSRDKSHSGIYDTEANDIIREIIAESVLESYKISAINA